MTVPLPPPPASGRRGRGSADGVETPLRAYLRVLGEAAGAPSEVLTAGRRCAPPSAVPDLPAVDRPRERDLRRRPAPRG